MDSVSAVAVTPDGRRAVSASRDFTPRLWDLESGQTLCTLQGHTSDVMDVAVTPVLGENRRKSFTPRQLARILWDFTYFVGLTPEIVKL